MALDAYSVGLAIACAILLFAVGWFLCARLKARRIQEIEHHTERRISKMVEKAGRERRATFLEEKNKWYDAKTTFERELDSKRRELEQRDEDLNEKESGILDQYENLKLRNKELNRRERDARQRAVRLDQNQQELEQVLAEQRALLERISGMNVDRAREMLLESIETDLRHTATAMGMEIMDQARERSERESKKIIAQAIERCSTDQTVQSSISVVALPDDDIKGRIVGKEGRNIISFEAATGVKVIVNDTPEAVVLSSFDPVKRDVARLAMEQLVKEGRINPSRVEEVVAECEDRIETLVEEEGRRAVREVGIDNMHSELVSMLGRLKYRTSYGQSVLGHAKEVAFLAGAMAAELRMDEMLARRAGLLHDIGKAVDQEQEGTHTDIGVALVRRHGEVQEVGNAILYHHGDAEASSPISFLVKAADAISSSRPGARRDDAEGYIRRVRDLEDIARGFQGVRDAYAINAGREIRVMVNAGRVDDERAKALSFEIAQRIRGGMTYPGEIQVTIIRQTVATQWAGRSNKRRKGRSRNRRGERRYEKGRSRNDADRKNVSSGNHKGSVTDLPSSARQEDNDAVSGGNLDKTQRIPRAAQANEGR
ncbi:MAG: ribonuclease Y [Gemmatimonadetes bacterium]|nr:ribonuclease Y [Gemmatimonadota bacterium]